MHVMFCLQPWVLWHLGFGSGLKGPEQEVSQVELHGNYVYTNPVLKGPCALQPEAFASVSFGFIKVRIRPCQKFE
jgi:hypothetical protein